MGAGGRGEGGGGRGEGGIRECKYTDIKLYCNIYSLGSRPSPSC